MLDIDVDGILVYVSDFLRRILETGFYNEHVYCSSKSHVSVEQLIEQMKQEVKSDLIRLYSNNQKNAKQ